MYTQYIQCQEFTVFTVRKYKYHVEAETLWTNAEANTDANNAKITKKYFSTNIKHISQAK